MEMMIDALAGTLESSDVMVRIGPANEPGIQLEIDSIVKQQSERPWRSLVSLARMWSSMIKARWSAC